MKTSLLVVAILSFLMLTACKKESEASKTGGTSKTQTRIVKDKGEALESKSLELKDVLVGKWQIDQIGLDNTEHAQFRKDGTLIHKGETMRWKLIGLDKLAIMKQADDTEEDWEIFKIASFSKDKMEMHEGGGSDKFVFTRMK